MYLYEDLTKFQKEELTGPINFGNWNARFKNKDKKKLKKDRF